MDAKDQRIAELEAEVHRLRSLLEGGDVVVRKKVRVHSSRPRDVNEVIRDVRRRRVAELVVGLKLLATVVAGLAVVISAYLLVDYLKKSRVTDPVAPPVAQDALQ